MAPATGTHDWVVLVLSSALVSAIVNVLSGFVSKIWDHRREDKKARKESGYAYLEIVMELEDFVRLASSRLFRINCVLYEFETYGDATRLEPLVRLEPITFAFKNEPNWLKLPIDVVAGAKELPIEIDTTLERISYAWGVGESDAPWLLKMQTQYLSFYGRKAYQEAAKIRRDIKLAPSSNIRPCLALFLETLEEWRSRFEQRPETALITALDIEFQGAVRTSKLKSTVASAAKRFIKHLRGSERASDA